MASPPFQFPWQQNKSLVPPLSVVFLTLHLPFRHSARQLMNQQSLLILPHECPSKPDPHHHPAFTPMASPTAFTQFPIGELTSGNSSLPTHCLEVLPSSLLTLPPESSYIKIDLIMGIFLTMSVSSPLPLGRIYQTRHHLTPIYFVSFVFCIKSALYICRAQARAEMEAHVPYIWR